MLNRLKKPKDDGVIQPFDWKKFWENEAERLDKKVKQLLPMEQKCKDQEAYIVQLEKQIELLQKTLNLVYKNKRKKGRCKRGRTQDVRKDNYRQ